MDERQRLTGRVTRLTRRLPGRLNHLETSRIESPAVDIILHSPTNEQYPRYRPTHNRTVDSKPQHPSLPPLSTPHSYVLPDHSTLPDHHPVSTHRPVSRPTTQRESCASLCTPPTAAYHQPPARRTHPFCAFVHAR